jgi:CRP/FNR family transcriptional regulator, cyclic AMP receptor protein
VIEAPELAVLGEPAQAVLGEFPEIYAVLVDRLAGRAHRVSVAQAISQLNGVDRRVLTLFWHLAERWGRISGEGVVVPLAVPHRIVAQLVGARRPTVSTALGALVREGRLTRLPDGGWLLRGEPVGLPVGEASRVIRMRRRHFAPGSQHTAEVG